MNIILKNSFEKMTLEYKRILEGFYPARGSAGFTEQNQTFNFVTALKNMLEREDTVQWLEFPWIDPKQHIDAVVYSPHHKSIFFIESKRFYNQKKLDKILDDVERVMNPMLKANNEVTEKGFEFLKPHLTSGDIEDIQKYVVVLGDVWLDKSKVKRKVPAWWLGSLDKAKNKLDFEGLVDSGEDVFHIDFDKDIVKITDQYYLLFGFKKIG